MRTCRELPHSYQVLDDGLLVAECWDRTEADRMTHEPDRTRARVVAYLRRRAEEIRDGAPNLVLDVSDAWTIADVLDVVASDLRAGLDLADGDV